MTEEQYNFMEFEVDSSDDTIPEIPTGELLENLAERREGDGLYVALLWNKLEGVLQIHARHEITGAEITFPVDKDHAIDAVNHPSPYAAKAGLPTNHLFPGSTYFEEAA